LKCDYAIIRNHMLVDCPSNAKAILSYRYAIKFSFEDKTRYISYKRHLCLKHMVKLKKHLLRCKFIVDLDIKIGDL